MARVAGEEELRTLRECLYSFPDQVHCDLRSVRRLYPDLRLHADFYCFPNKEKKRLVHLKGTIPVLYEGGQYNIPVCIWLHETHPVSRPRCYVVPSVSMVINTSCPCVDATGNVHLHALSSWTHGVSNLTLLVSEMRRAFQKDTPLYARAPGQAPPPASDRLQPPAPSLPVSQWEKSKEVGVRRSYTEELMGIDFSVPPRTSSSSNPPGVVGALQRLSLGPESRAGGGSGRPPPQLPPDQAAMFESLLGLEGRSFSPDDIMEAVTQSADLASALRFLSHCCPLCQDRVPFSKIITMTHCSCSLCEACFRAFFSSAIRERSVEHLSCPQCRRPDPRGEDATEYYNLLDTQIRHFLPQLHELFQRKLRDRALQDMPAFRWCAHCSFGVLHEAARLRMDCPSCNKSTCSQCRAPWTPQHQGRSCQQFRVWQQQNQPDPPHTPALLQHTSIECPQCLCVFLLSRGGCLHFTCSQCQHQFCGGCSAAFRPGAACRFSEDCGSRGLHAHHPRDCLYHLRDWPLARLQRLLQCYRASPSWLDPASGGSPDAPSGLCPVELRDEASGTEEPCGRPAPPETRGYCQ